MEPLPKHVKYGTSYTPNTVYWGLGVEEETYLELDRPLVIPMDYIKHHRKRERYSIDYWNTYKAGAAEQVLDAWAFASPQTTVALPVLLNAHALARTDRFGQPKTTYELEPKPNPAFCGTTLLEDLSGVQPTVFRGGKDVWWTLDGDAVEFMTQKYYNAQMEDVVEELVNHKRAWLSAFREGLSMLPDREEALHASVDYVQKNHGLATFLTNRTEVAAFNNGTYHVNLTLPTRLDSEARIADEALFVEQHRRLARLFQWISPFLVARYGSGDVLASLAGVSPGFPAGSQRLCACRYVGVGTFDTERMATGKILTLPYERVEWRWFEQLYDVSGCAYKALPALGLDMNFNKHWNHGLEFRIFDWFPESRLPELLRLLVWMCDESLARDTVPNPLKDPLWNQVLARCVWQGCTVEMTAVEMVRFREVLRIPEFWDGRMTGGFAALWAAWGGRWNAGGACSARMIRVPLSSSLVEPMNVLDPTTPVPATLTTSASAVPAASTDISGAASVVPVAPVATVAPTDVSGASVAVDISGTAIAAIAAVAAVTTDVSGATTDTDISGASVAAVIIDVSGAAITTKQSDLSGAAVDTAPVPVVGKNKFFCCW